MKKSENGHRKKWIDLNPGYWNVTWIGRLCIYDSLRKVYIVSIYIYFLSMVSKKMHVCSQKTWGKLTQYFWSRFFFSCMFHIKMLQCIVVCFDLTGEILVWNFSGLRKNNLFWLLEIFFLPCPCFLVSLWMFWEVCI